MTQPTTDSASSPAPLVSVIIATYNWSSVLRHAIESVLAQTFQDFELLCIGDGCTDDSAAVVASFGDPRIRWHNLPANSGNQSLPNNAGLEMARGTYIAYHGHDDLWLPGHLALLVAAIQAEDADLAHTLAVMIGPEGSGIRVLTGISATGRYDPEKFVPPSSIMHRRDVTAQCGMWRDYRTLTIPPDREFISRVWKYRQRCATVQELTTFKFNASWRRNSYREKPCHEQAECLRRMQTEPDFLAKELLAITRAYALGNTKTPADVKTARVPANAPPGWQVEQWRKIRGLEPQELAAASSTRAPGALLKNTKKGLRRMVESLARRLSD